MVRLTPSFELEIKALDDDHAKLVKLANEISSDIDSNNAHECIRLVPKFVEFSKQHFLREEALLKKTGYPNSKKHHDHHVGLSDKIDHILEFAKVAKNNPLAQASLKKELTYLLMDDIITSDMEFKDFVKSKYQERN